jgi:predicted transcriptional regulator
LIAVKGESRSGKNCASPPFFYIMLLQTILFGDFVPPMEVSSRKHFIGFEGGKKYVPNPDQRRKQISGMSAGLWKCYDCLRKQKKHVSAVEMGKKMKVTTNHAGLLLSQLHKLGKAVRYKVSANGTRYYMYLAKENENGSY